jgi:hypothetical protein
MALKYKMKPVDARTMFVRIVAAVCAVLIATSALFAAFFS